MACLGAVVGLAVERTILRARAPAFQRPADLWILDAGASAARAETLADTLISRGATALLSFGIAGGLDPALRPGTVVLAREVVLPDGARLAADAAWADRVASAARTMTPHRAAIAGSERILTSTDQKVELHRRTAAAAVDMESHGVARAAARRSLPFLVIRAVADPAERALPQSAIAGLDGGGTVRPLSTLASLARDPRQLAALFGVATDTLTALAALWRFAGHVGRAVAPANA
ncbi:MAG: phosphorylase [Alphaproteobacteria bacterium]|nr:phosphorylase [Alphaproteobacteria bacterium]